MPPSTETCPTPVTVLRRWPINVSARSPRSRIETESDVSASVTMAVSAGLTFE